MSTKTQQVETIINDNDDIWKIFDMLRGNPDDETTKLQIPNTQDEFCIGCNSRNLMMDNSSGSIVCSHCGLVAVDHLIDQTAEWRDYTDDCGVKTTKQRASLYINPMFPVASTATTFTGFARTPMEQRMKKLLNRSSIPYAEKMLMEVKNLIQQSYPELSESIQNDAIYIYKGYKSKVNERTGKIPINRAGNRKGIIAACVKKACQRQNIILSDKELAEKFNCNNPSIVSFGNRQLDSHLRRKGIKFSPIVNVDPKSFISKYCSKLGLPQQITNQVYKVIDTIMSVRSSEQKLVSSKPKSLAAGCLWYVIKTRELDKPLENHSGFSKQFVCHVTGVSEVTINTLFTVISSKINE